MADDLTRDLADVAGEVGDIAVGIKHAGKWLGDAYADDATEKIRPAICELYRARAALNTLIAELEESFVLAAFDARCDALAPSAPSAG